jgi:hypothetical protein
MLGDGVRMAEAIRWAKPHFPSLDHAELLLLLPALG